jgi:hypothetical protein
MDPISNRPPARATLHGEPAEPASGITARTARRAATLERDSARLVTSASRAGVEITYVGTAPLFDEPRAYAGRQTDWIIGPAADHSDAIVPADIREQLRRLIHAGIDFSLVYVAHEIPKGRLAIPAGTATSAGSQPVNLRREAAAAAVGPVPPPAGTTELADRLGHSSQRLLNMLRTAVPIAAGIAAAPVLIASAPFVLAGAAITALAVGLDPIVFGVIPAGPVTSGQPGAWYILARWEWPDGPDQPHYQPSASSSI